MSKAALDQMMRSLAIDLIAEDVRVNNVNPGVVVTQFIQNMGVPDEMAQKMYDSFASNRAVLPCGKVGNPSDIANVIAFLADRSQSFYIVGQTIVADGGTSIVLAMSSANTTFAELLK
ncbi:3-oxoacyl-[acyl-carrier-protein] reductase domain protein [Necator americanus]|nr:3-oxoacyl-[acyl-carrier-protein] reductase domain protein [Necator americanus]ETN73990.1 3-oxoacyl-[acyl-carrier-protein] reductase domain protein [Necator americanus]